MVILSKLSYIKYVFIKRKRFCFQLHVQLGKFINNLGLYNNNIIDLVSTSTSIEEDDLCTNIIS